MQENLSDNYGWNAAAPESCEYLVPAVVDLLHGLKAWRVIDIGAGNGALCAALSAAGYEVVGIEADPRGYQLARKAVPGARFYNLRVESDPAALLGSEVPFDAAVSTEVVEHLYAPQSLPAFAKALLKPGGYFVVSTPYHGYWKNLALALLGRWDKHHDPLWHGGHIKFWSRATLTRLLTDAGFDVVAFKGVGRAPFLWKSMILVARLAPKS